MDSKCKYRTKVHSLVRHDGVTNGAFAKDENENGVAIINVWVEKFRYGFALGNERMSFATGHVNAKSLRSAGAQCHRGLTSPWRTWIHDEILASLRHKSDFSRSTDILFFSLSLYFSFSFSLDAHARRVRECVRVGINRRINYPIRHEPFITQ